MAWSQPLDCSLGMQALNKDQQRILKGSACISHPLPQTHSSTCFFTDALKFIFKWKLLGVIHINSFPPIMSSYQARIICLKSQLTNGSLCRVEQTGRQGHTVDVCISTSHLDSLLQSVVRNGHHCSMSHFISFKRLISPYMKLLLRNTLYPPQRRLG